MGEKGRLYLLLGADSGLAALVYVLVLFSGYFHVS